jgi:hypothetical protein
LTDPRRLDIQAEPMHQGICLDKALDSAIFIALSRDQLAPTYRATVGKTAAKHHRTNQQEPCE